jgi:hypothetical protein
MENTIETIMRHFDIDKNSAIRIYNDVCDIINDSEEYPKTVEKANHIINKLLISR